MTTQNNEAPEVVLSRLIAQAGLTIATAESCTGGLISHLITNVSGSSAYFLGGVVSYSNEAKTRILKVSRSSLARHGAVSEEVAREMARGARRLFHADIALSATGIAGPLGGTPEKPVGLVYIGMANPEGGIVEKHIWDGDRETNKRRTAVAALEMANRYLAEFIAHMGEKEEP